MQPVRVRASRFAYAKRRKYDQVSRHRQQSVLQYKVNTYVLVRVCVLCAYYVVRVSPVRGVA